MQRVQAVREIHEAAGNVELATAAQREYDRLVRNDDKLLNQIEELQGRKAFAPESQRQD